MDRSETSRGRTLPTDTRPRPIHPVHAVLLAGSLPLFLGAMLSDWAYANTYVVQWTNFAAWLLVGALILTGAALVWAVVDLFHRRGGHNRRVYVGVLAAVFVLGLLNALVHARDAWATMPTAMVLSVIVLALALVTTWLGFSGAREGQLS